MDGLNTHEQRVISNHAAAILTRVNQLAEKGSTLEYAKRKAIRDYDFNAAPYNMRPLIKHVAEDFTFEDLDSFTLKTRSDRMFRKMTMKGIKDNWVNRFLWNRFGVTL